MYTHRCIHIDVYITAKYNKIQHTNNIQDREKERQLTYSKIVRAIRQSNDECMVVYGFFVRRCFLVCVFLLVCFC